LYTDEDRLRKGYFSDDRGGNKVFHPLVSLSIGAVKVAPLQYSSPHQIASAATRAKTQAKKTAGNVLFVEQRIAVNIIDASALLAVSPAAAPPCASCP
jgi:hypothetical protein